MTDGEIIKASVAYNERQGKLKVFGGSAILSDEEYYAFNQNPDFIAGAQWDRKILIDKACKWIHLHIGELNDLYIRTAIIEEFIEDFRKAMEE